ncbi:hypothetical protein EDB83DRAFT_2316244 [Lactarius deliciosus]|nr:hypothetical protein EDB83DRAFT_2316244 [Lactarius deliciosus]
MNGLIKLLDGGEPDFIKQLEKELHLPHAAIGFECCTSWTLGLIVEVEGDELQYKYNPQSDFSTSIRGFLHLVTKVVSDRSALLERLQAGQQGPGQNLIPSRQGIPLAAAWGACSKERGAQAQRQLLRSRGSFGGRAATAFKVASTLARLLRLQSKGLFLETAQEGWARQTNESGRLAKRGAAGLKETREGN